MFAEWCVGRGARVLATGRKMRLRGPEPGPAYWREDVMNTIRNVATVLSAALLVSLAACASSMPRAERLALYQAHAGEPMQKIPYFSPQGWEEVDENHILLTMRPSEVYLMKLNAPCLDYDNGKATMLITNTAGYVQEKFDRVSFGSGMNYRIEETQMFTLSLPRAVRGALRVPHYR